MMASPNLRAQVSKLSQRTAELKGVETKKKPQKKPRRKDDTANKPAPSVRRKEPNKLTNLLSTRGQRATEAVKSRFKDPLNKRLKDVIAVLLKRREDLTKDEICSEKEKQIDADDVELWEAVMNNQRIEVLENGKLRYRPRHHHIVDKEQLLMHVRRHPSGTFWNDVSDTYKNVDADLEMLLTDKKVFAIENPDREDKVIFWNDPIVESDVLSDDILQLWKDIELPPDKLQFEDLLKKTEISPAPRKASRKREAVQKVPKERKSKDFKYRKITNTHMPELFRSDQPEQID